MKAWGKSLEIAWVVGVFSDIENKVVCICCSRLIQISISWWVSVNMKDGSGELEGSCAGSEKT